MSVKQMAKVWEYELPHNHQSIMLAMADHANDEGGSIFPSLERVAWKTGYKRGSVKRIVRELKVIGLLVIVKRASRHRPTEYRINWKVATKKTPYVAGVKNNPLDIADEILEGTNNASGGTSETARGYAPAVKGVHSYDPLTIIKPSINKPSNKPLSSHGEMCAALSKATVLDLKLYGSRIGKIASELIKAGYFPDDINNYIGRHSWWYKNNWKGKRGEVPNLEDIKSTITKARKAKQPTRAFAGGSDADFFE
jgi:hypothetical protein